LGGKKESNPKIILVVTHGGFIMEFINAFKSIYGGPTHKDVFKNNAKNTSVNIFDIL
jgi:broad specificity phosphatase PhoE